MKFSVIYKLVLAFFVIGTSACFELSAEDSTGKEWPTMPDLVLQDCIPAEQSVTHNPFSKITNDYLIITAYEEHKGVKNLVPKESNVSKHAGTLNIYLMLGVFIVEDKTEGLVHEMTLVVQERYTNARTSEQKSWHSWLLMDVDGDGRLDKAIYCKNMVENNVEQPGNEDSMNLSSAKLPALQEYFEGAVHSLGKKTAENPTDSCIML